ncbi:energy transducer TonB [Paucibacter sp. AS339]|uniref:energy transducer TonB n=1 Tax=Paucibacter hankyongi TaxID=3133434 RepID=UPI0030B48EF9
MSKTTPTLSRWTRMGLGLLGALLIASSAIAAPKVLKKVPPEFPAAAVKKGVKTGSVKAQISIAPDGKVTEVTILESTPPKVFDKAVIEALMEWRFEGNGEKQSHELKLVFNSED